MRTCIALLTMVTIAFGADTGDTGGMPDTGDSFDTADSGSTDDTGDTAAPTDFIDIDCDGINDIDDSDVQTDADADGDGITNLREVEECLTDPCTPQMDADEDGVSNADEALFGTDACDSRDPNQTIDDDCDTIPDYRDEEVEFEDFADNDGDGVQNIDELGACESDPCVPNIDPDADGIPTETELACGADPCSPDSDNDGIWDGEEIDGDGSCGPDSDGDGDPDLIDPDNGLQHGAADEVLDRSNTRHGLQGGSFTGGACHTAGQGAGWLPLFIVIGALLSRRRTPLLLLTLLVVLPARAQELDAQHFRPAVDGRRFVIVDDPFVGPNGPGGHLLMNHARELFMYRYPDRGPDPVPLLDRVWTADLLLHWNIQPVMIGLSSPMHLSATGLHVDSAGNYLVGDTQLDAKVSLLEASEDPIGLGFSSRLGFPTGNGRAWLGHPGVTGTGQVDLSWGTRVVVAANMGIHMARPTYLQDVEWGTAALWRAGVSVPLHERVWVSSELDGIHQLSSAKAVGANPIEGLLATRVTAWRSLFGTLGAGTGLNQGIGAPAYRIFFGIGWVDAPAAKPSPEPTPPTAAPTPAPEQPPRVENTDIQVLLREKIFFALNSAQLKPESQGLLDEMVIAVLDHPEITLIEIQGHSDGEGTKEYNRVLSQSRAEAVMLYMVQHSVDAQRLLARGYGETRPSSDTDSEDTLATNRRVEFHIVDRK